MIRKFKFYLDDKESDIYEYDTEEYDDEQSLMWDMEDDRNDWTYSIINTGYIEIEHDIQCNNCDWTGFEEDLIEHNESKN